jgi:arylsulfate sulfotransferase
MSVTNDPGPSPFISMVHIGWDYVTSVTAVEYTIAPKPGSVSNPVHVEYAMPALQNRGYVSARGMTVPVYGLYAGYDNQVSMDLHLGNGKTVSFEVDITTEDYTDPTGIYSKPDVIVKRAAGSPLGFSFIYIKSNMDSPVILDTDGEIRWAVPNVPASPSSAFVGDTFFIGSAASPTVYQLRLDGGVGSAPLPSTPENYIDFGHDITAGKYALLAEPDARTDGVEDIESNVIEMSDSNTSTPAILSNWDLGAIISAYMTSQGDDAAAFVRPGKDWFHLNSAIYDPSDDSLIVSSRENFIIKLDYGTGAIKWILGDPTKYWYTFPSLRAKALTLNAGGLYPIGQHALSITPAGLLMIFNDGLGSANQPTGEPAGQTRTYSAVSAYSIDAASMTAQNVWNYDANPSIFSSVCSSAYQTPDQSMLVDYATADNITQTILMGLNPSQNVVFEFEYPTYECNTAWNARPFPLDNLVVDQ